MPMRLLQESLFSTNITNNNPTTSWVNKKFSNPNVHIRLATVFSGIGAIE